MDILKEAGKILSFTTCHRKVAWVEGCKSRLKTAFSNVCNVISENVRYSYKIMPASDKNLRYTRVAFYTYDDRNFTKEQTHFRNAGLSGK
jgi:hypothetical protein